MGYLKYYNISDPMLKSLVKPVLVLSIAFPLKNPVKYSRILK